MHYDRPDRLLLDEQKKRTTEVLNEIRAVAKRKSDDDFSDFVERNEDEFSYNPQFGRYQILFHRSRNAQNQFRSVKELSRLQQFRHLRGDVSLFFRRTSFPADYECSPMRYAARSRRRQVQSRDLCPQR